MENTLKLVLQINTARLHCKECAFNDITANITYTFITLKREKLGNLENEKKNAFNAIINQQLLYLNALLPRII